MKPFVFKNLHCKNDFFNFTLLILSIFYFPILLLITLKLETFESLKQEEEGCKFWSARKLAKTLEYSEYRHLLHVIEKAQDACKNSGHNNVDHFEYILDMIDW